MAWEAVEALELAPETLENCPGKVESITQDRTVARLAALWLPAMPIRTPARHPALQNPVSGKGIAEIGALAVPEVKLVAVPGPPAAHPLTRAAVPTAGQAQVQVQVQL